MPNEVLPNFNDAALEYDSETYKISEFDELAFSKYSPAFVMSNEPLRFETAITPNAQNVLTVAASGDQALFYKLSGAKHIDTFDISYCARVIQDIKTAVISELPYTEYEPLLNDLFRTTNALNIKQIKAISHKIPSPCIEFMRAMIGHNIFNYGTAPIFLRTNLPTKKEYAFIRSQVNKPFNFIWTDILDLHTKLNKQYDVINLSNISDYMTPTMVIRIIKNLEPFLSINGSVIICDWEKQMTDATKRSGDKFFDKFGILEWRKWRHWPSTLFPTYDSILRLRKIR